jgi:hypothetical protein
MACRTTNSIHNNKKKRDECDNPDYGSGYGSINANPKQRAEKRPRFNDSDEDIGEDVAKPQQLVAKPRQLVAKPKQQAKKRPRFNDSSDDEIVKNVVKPKQRAAKRRRVIEDSSSDSDTDAQGYDNRINSYEQTHPHIYRFLLEYIIYDNDEFCIDAAVDNFIIVVNGGECGSIKETTKNSHIKNVISEMLSYLMRRNIHVPPIIDDKALDDKMDDAIYKASNKHWRQYELLHALVNDGLVDISERKLQIFADTWL